MPRPYVWFGIYARRWYVWAGRDAPHRVLLPGTRPQGYSTAASANDAARHAIPDEPA